MRKILESEVVFSVSIEQDNIPVRGNALASGDSEEDRKQEDEILQRLDNGDTWAWAAVTVHATITLPDGSTMTGEDHLGGCSYADEADFTQPGGYYDDMRHEALADLQHKIEAEIKRGAMLAELFADDCVHTIGSCEVCTPSSEQDT